MGKIPNFTDSERLKTPKTDCALKVYKRQRILSAWIPGLSTLKVTGFSATLTYYALKFILGVCTFSIDLYWLLTSLLLLSSSPPLLPFPSPFHTLRGSLLLSSPLIPFSPPPSHYILTGDTWFYCTYYAAYSTKCSFLYYISLACKTKTN